jgi:hypothetical protein
MHEQVRLAFRAELYGALNHAVFATNQNQFPLYTGLNYVGVTNPVVTTNNLVSGYSSVSTNISGTRTIQLGLKLYF